LTQALRKRRERQDNVMKILLFLSEGKKFKSRNELESNASDPIKLPSTNTRRNF